MSEKVTVSITLPTIPREVAEAIETARKQGVCNATIIDVRNDDHNIMDVSRGDLRLIPFDTLLSALVNGYTVEKSAEELAHDKIRRVFERRSFPVALLPDRAYIGGIRFTLDTLGIKIEGVNA